MRLLLFLGMIVISLSGIAQDIPEPCTTSDTSQDPVYTVVETMPSFPGGEQARIKFLTDNIHYPDLARESKIEGMVFATFIVEKNGKISDVRILRGIGGGCDEETIRVLRLMPPWIPGKCSNNPVRVQFNMPIKYTLGVMDEKIHSDPIYKKKKKFLFF